MGSATNPRETVSGLVGMDSVPIQQEDRKLLKEALILGVAVLCAARPADADIVNFTEGGVNDSTNGGWEQLLTVTGQVDMFNVAGATLLSYTVYGDVQLTFSGELTLVDIQQGGFGTIDGFVGAPTMLGGPTPALAPAVTATCDQDDLTCGNSITVPFSIPVADLASVIGPGAMDVNASGQVNIFSLFNVSLLAGSDTATLSILNLRAEGGYCTTDTNTNCAALYPDNPVVGSTPVPEPGTLGLFGIALAGLGFVRRRRPAN